MVRARTSSTSSAASASRAGADSSPARPRNSRTDSASASSNPVRSSVGAHHASGGGITGVHCGRNGSRSCNTTVPAAMSPMHFPRAENIATVIPSAWAEAEEHEPGSLQHEPDQPAHERLPESDRPTVVAHHPQSERHLPERPTAGDRLHRHRVSEEDENQQ